MLKHIDEQDLNCPEFQNGGEDYHGPSDSTNGPSNGQPSPFQEYVNGP